VGSSRAAPSRERRLFLGREKAERRVNKVESLREPKARTFEESATRALVRYWGGGVVYVLVGYFRSWGLVYTVHLL